MAPKLIRTIDEVRGQVPVNMTSDFDVISPFLVSAESSYVRRLIGADQFTALVTLYGNGTWADGTTQNQKDAVSLCQKVTSNLGYFFATPVLSVQIGSTGITVISNDQTKQAFQWQVSDLKEALISLGFGGIEELLSLLEDNSDDFPAFAASDELAAQKNTLIQTAAEFSQYYSINNSRLIFSSIAYIAKRIEQQNLVKLFGATFFASLKAGDLSDEKQTLVDTYIKPGLALLTVAKALIERVITLENGLVTYNFKGRDNNMAQSQPATNQQIADQALQLNTDGDTFLQDGLQFILDNPTDFEDFVAPVPRRRFMFKNQKDKGVFGV